MKRSTSILSLILNTWWLRHLLFWLFILTYLAWAWGFGHNKLLTIEQCYINASCYLPGSFVVVYPLLYYLIPEFLVKRRLLLFFLGFAGLLFISYHIAGFIQSIDRFKDYLSAGFNLRTGNNILPYIMFAGFATSLKLLKYFYFEENRALTARQEKDQAELELLKSQIHPHFLFNTLNNLFAHTLRNSPDSPKIVVKLSDILRFMIYESRVDLIPLPQEIMLLKNYINLEKLRFGQDLEVSATFNGEFDDLKIAPLLLLPLVENSFKYGTSRQLEQKWITLDLHVEGSVLHFKLANSIAPGSAALFVSGEPKGLSVDNVKRRLELLYPEKYQLSIKQQEDIYLVSLEIQLVGDLKTQLYPSLT